MAATKKTISNTVADRSAPKPPLLNDAAIATLIAVAALLLLLSLRPLAGIPRNDDFSYARTAEAFAKTGHIAYNGWGSPAMIPQAIIGAALIRIFGFSYRVFEWFGIFCAAGAASAMFLLCRACRLSRNASLTATAVLTLNAVFLCNAPAFLNDLPSLMLLLFACYFLIRSITGREFADVSINRWRFAVAVLLAIVAGCNRQVSWAAFLAALAPLFFAVRSRDDRIVIGVGGAAILLCGGVVTSWWSHQRYIVPADLWTGVLFLVGYTEALAPIIYKFFLLFGVFILPITLLALRGSDFKRFGFWFAIFLLLIPLPFPVSKKLSYFNPYYGASATGQYFTSLGAKIGFLFPMSTPEKPIFPPIVVDTLIVLGGLGLGLSLYLMVVWLKERRLQPASPSDLPVKLDAVPRRVAADSMALASLIQIVGSLPWFAMMRVFDRYFLFYLPGFSILFLTQAALRTDAYGERDLTRFPRQCVAAVIIAAMAVVGYGIAADYMNSTGAEGILYHRLLERGVPAEQIDNSFELDGDTQIRDRGYVNQRVMTPLGIYDPNAHGRNIATSTPDLFPVMDGHYLLTPDPHPVTDFAIDPEPSDQQDYFSFFPPRHRTMYELHVTGTSTAP